MDNVNGNIPTTLQKELSKEWKTYKIKEIPRTFHIEKNKIIYIEILIGWKLNCKKESKFYTTKHAPYFQYININNNIDTQTWS